MKLGARDRAQLIGTAYEVGLLSPRQLAEARATVGITS
jgi:hypothetical protein